MNLDQLTNAALDRLGRNGSSADLDHVFPDLLLLRSSCPTQTSPTLYEPIACLILQGAKEVLLGESVFTLGRGDLLVVSHDVPVNSRITNARPGVPYLAVVLVLDTALLHTIHAEAGRALPRALSGGAGSAAMAKTAADPQLVDALFRYLALANNDLERQMLAGAIRREIHFRLLTSPASDLLRNLLRADSHASLVAQAIARIRKDFRSSITVPDLAREVGMSPSALHKHFRAVTSTTPLQFQKDLRLLEARRLLIAGRHAVSDVAWEVGYESPNQFSREYARKFGVPPSVDLRTRAATV